MSQQSTPPSPAKHIINFQQYYKDDVKFFVFSPTLTKQFKITTKMVPYQKKKLKFLGPYSKYILFFIASKTKEAKPVSGLCQGEITKRAGGKKEESLLEESLREDSSGFLSTLFSSSNFPFYKLSKPDTSIHQGNGDCLLSQSEPDTIGTGVRGSRKSVGRLHYHCLARKGRQKENKWSASWTPHTGTLYTCKFLNLLKAHHKSSREGSHLDIHLTEGNQSCSVCHRSSEGSSRDVRQIPEAT